MRMLSSFKSFTFWSYLKKIDENVDKLSMCLVSNRCDNTLNEKQRFKKALNWRTTFAESKAH